MRGGWWRSSGPTLPSQAFAPPREKSKHHGSPRLLTPAPAPPLGSSPVRGGPFPPRPSPGSPGPSARLRCFWSQPRTAHTGGHPRAPCWVCSCLHEPALVFTRTAGKQEPQKLFSWRYDLYQSQPTCGVERLVLSQPQRLDRSVLPSCPAVGVKQNLKEEQKKPTAEQTCSVRYLLPPSTGPCPTPAHI